MVGFSSGFVNFGLNKSKKARGDTKERMMMNGQDAIQTNQPAKINKSYFCDALYELLPILRF